jgi:release factor glutamine methyltransferase
MPPSRPPALLEILNKTSDYFKSKGIDNHRLDAQLLLCHVLGMRRLDLYMNFDRPMTEEELARYRDLVKRRAAREPLQHLLGSVPFREITLKVDRRALIPRQETELIVDLVRKALPATALDIGVGAGPIYLSLLKEIPGCRVSGVDISETCVLLTRENAAANGLPVEDLQVGDAFAPFAPDRRWDVIVSNPPYVGEIELPGLAPEVRDHDPRTALIGGREGWEFPARLIEAAYSHLNADGLMIVEIGAGQYPILKAKTVSQPWKSCLASQDYQGIDRFLLLQK